MTARTNADVAQVLAQLATMLELDGANVFRVRAYREAARVVDASPEPVYRLADEEGALEALPGIGKDLAQKIRDILETGTTALHAEMLKKYPLELVRLTELQGLGAKRVRQLHDALGIADRAGLEAAARAGRLRELPGFGEKMEQKILHSLSIAEQASGGCCWRARGRWRTPWPTGCAGCRASPGSSWRARSAGAARRWATSTCWCAAARRTR